MPNQVHYRSCNLCEAICGLEIVTQNDRVVSIRGDAQDPLSQGHICPKAVALQDLYQDPKRLRTPLLRQGDSWQSLPWDEAFDLAIARIKDVQNRFGPHSVAVYQGNPSVHNSGTLLSAPGFFKALGTQNRFSATSVDQLPHHFAAWQMLGHPLLMPIPDLDRTQYFLVLGANPLASNGSLMTAPGVRKRLGALQKRGGKLVVIDPRRSETAQKADEHHFIRPGTDALLLLAMLQVLWAHQRVHLGRLAEFSDGLSELAQVVAPFTPQAVAGATGIAAPTIERLALEFSAAPAAVAYGRIGLSTQSFGGLCQWLINALNVVSGNFDRQGGAMLATPAIDLLARAKPGQSYFGRFHSRVRGLPEFDGELPVAALTEEIETPGPGQIKALITCAGNPVLSTPAGHRLEKALEGLDFLLSIDIYLNETTRHAHLILPPASGLETDHYDLIFHAFAVRNTAKYSAATLPKDPQAKYDWEIFEELRNRYTNTPAAPRNPVAKIEASLRSGPYALSIEQLLAHPSGLDLGPLQPRLPQSLLTANGRLQLAPPLLLADLSRLSQTVFNLSALRLIGRRELRSNNSWMHHIERLNRGPERCTLRMNPQDAAQRGLQAGMRVKVQSRVGQIEVPLEITAEIMPGVVSLPHGYGHHRPGVQLSPGGVSLNDLTDPLHLDALTGNAALSGLEVQVHPV